MIRIGNIVEDGGIWALGKQPVIAHQWLKKLRKVYLLGIKVRRFKKYICSLEHCVPSTKISVWSVFHPEKCMMLPLYFLIMPSSSDKDSRITMKCSVAQKVSHLTQTPLPLAISRQPSLQPHPLLPPLLLSLPHPVISHFLFYAFASAVPISCNVVPTHICLPEAELMV